MGNSKEGSYRCHASCCRDPYDEQKEQDRSTHPDGVHLLSRSNLFNPKAPLRPKVAVVPLDPDSLDSWLPIVAQKPDGRGWCEFESVNDDCGEILVLSKDFLDRAKDERFRIFRFELSSERYAGADLAIFLGFRRSSWVLFVCPLLTSRRITTLLVQQYVRDWRRYRASTAPT